MANENDVLARFSQSLNACLSAIQHSRLMKQQLINEDNHGMKGETKEDPDKLMIQDEDGDDSAHIDTTNISKKSDSITDEVVKSCNDHLDSPISERN